MPGLNLKVKNPPEKDKKWGKMLKELLAEQNDPIKKAKREKEAQKAIRDINMSYDGSKKMTI